MEQRISRNWDALTIRLVASLETRQATVTSSLPVERVYGWAVLRKPGGGVTCRVQRRLPAASYWTSTRALSLLGVLVVPTRVSTEGMLLIASAKSPLNSGPTEVSQRVQTGVPSRRYFASAGLVPVPPVAGSPL